MNLIKKVCYSEERKSTPKPNPHDDSAYRSAKSWVLIAGSFYWEKFIGWTERGDERFNKSFDSVFLSSRQRDAIRRGGRARLLLAKMIYEDGKKSSHVEVTRSVFS